MVREEKRRRRTRETPPPLPPETRTIGQLVAETIRFYAGRFWPSLALGLLPGIAFYAGSFFGGVTAAFVVAGVATVAYTASFVGGAVLVGGVQPTTKRLLEAFGVGLVAYLPVFLFFGLFAIIGLIPAILWLGLVGMIVPALVIEDLRPRAAVSRGLSLNAVDGTHAFGSVATLLVLTLLVSVVMSLLIRTGSGQTVRLAVSLARVVVTPVLFLGLALLYYDQAARLKLKSAPCIRRRPDADVPHADDADRPGSADAPIAS